MRHAHVIAVALLTSSGIAAADGPVGRFGVVGGYDASAPSHREDGLAAGAGYHLGPWTGELDYSYLEYDGSSGIGGGASRAGVLLQHELYSQPCRDGTCPHVDLDLGAGYRWVTWNFQQPGFGPAASPLSFRGREVEIGLSANFLIHLALHYVRFDADADSMAVACRSTRGCSQGPPNVGHSGLLLEASFVLGGS